MGTKACRFFGMMLVISTCAVDSMAQAPRAATSSAETPRPVISVAKLSAQEAAILEAALRESLSRARADDILFVSLGGIGPNRKDPSPEFLRRLDDLKLKLRPVSAARLPEPGEMAAPNRYRGVEDPATGRDATVHWALVIHWFSDTKVRVVSDAYRGPLCGTLCFAIYELRDGKWQLTVVESSGIS